MSSIALCDVNTVNQGWKKTNTFAYYDIIFLKNTVLLLDSITWKDSWWWFILYTVSITTAR